MDFVLEFLFGIMASIITTRLGSDDDVSEQVLELLILACMVVVGLMVSLVALRPLRHLFYVYAAMVAEACLLFGFHGSDWKIVPQLLWIVLGTLYTWLRTGHLLRLKNAILKLAKSLVNPQDTSPLPLLCLVHSCCTFPNPHPPPPPTPPTCPPPPPPPLLRGLLLPY